MLKSSHRPYGKIAHALALILAYATAADASINYSGYVPQRPSISHRPDGKIADACLDSHLHNCGRCSGQLQPYVRASETDSKLPIAPMGTLLTRLPRLTLPQLRTLRSTTGCTCCRDLAKFPSPRWENC